MQSGFPDFTQVLVFQTLPSARLYCPISWFSDLRFWFTPNPPTLMETLSPLVLTSPHLQILEGLAVQEDQGHREPQAGRGVR